MGANVRQRSAAPFDLQMAGAGEGLRIGLPIVFISGSVDIPTAFQAIKDGAVDFLQKPNPQQQLMDAIHKALQLVRT